MIAVDATVAPHVPASPERQLWCAVLDQVLTDLSRRLPPPPRVLTPGWTGERRFSIDMAKWQTRNSDTISARHFAFSKANKWRGTVCDLAGITEECFVKSARARTLV